MQQRMNEQFDVANKVYLEAKCKINDDKDKKLQCIREIQATMLSEEENLEKTAGEFAQSSRKYSHMMDTKVKNAAISVENLQNYKYFEDVEAQIYSVIVKAKPSQVEEYSYRKFTDSEDQSLSEIQQLNEKLKQVLAQNQDSKPKRTYEGDHPEFRKVPRVKNEEAVDPSQEENFQKLIEDVETRMAEPRSKRKLSLIEPTVLESEIEFDNPIIEQHMEGKNVHQKLMEIQNHPLVQKENNDVNENKNNKSVKDHTGEVVKETKNDIEIPELKPDENVIVEPQPEDVKYQELVNYPFVWLPAEGFLRHIEVNTDLLIDSEKLKKPKSLKLIKKRSIKSRKMSNKLHEQSVIIENHQKLEVDLKPQVDKSERSGSALRIRKIKNDSFVSMSAQKRSMGTPKVLRDVNVKGSEGRRKTYSRLRESTKMMNVKDFIKQNLINYS